MKTTQSQSEENRCIIVGAGIAGLTAALALVHFGFSVLILEKAENLDEVGAGLQLSPNATSILAKLGILDALLPAATILHSIDLMSARSGKALLSLKTAPLSTQNAPFLAVHRADLQAELLRQVRLNPSIELQYGVTFLNYTFQATGINVRCQTTKKQLSLLGCCLIGADGVWSAVRQSNGGPRAQFSSYVAHRQTIECPQLTLDSLKCDHCVKALVSPHAHLVAYPISQGKRINLVFITKQANPARELPLSPDVSRFAPQLAEYLASDPNWTHWPIHTIDSDARWRLNERTILIGDAAHAMLPFGAQGAAMAIEDAYTLAYCLAHERTNVSSALRTYETFRRKRVKQVSMRSKFNALAYHASGPLAVARNLVFAAKGQRLMADLEWLYAYRAPEIT